MGNRRSLLRISDLTASDIENITNSALNLKSIDGKILENKTVINLFFESSTRTLTSFTIAAKGLGANVVNLPVQSSSMSKGEDLQDMIKTLNAMDPDFIIIRHQSSGIIDLLKQHVKCSVVNAGDGSNEHPTQALADYAVIKKHKKHVRCLKVVICGDILHSRVSRSNIRLLKMFGAEISLVAPPTLMCKYLPGVDSIHHSLDKSVIEGADVIMLLRLQKERMNSGYFIPSKKEYFSLYGLNMQKLSHAKPDMLIMHPGPVNRGVEIGTDVPDSVILEQVRLGVEVRKATLHLLSSTLKPRCIVQGSDDVHLV